MTVYGYARVSTRGQDLSLQIDQLERVGVEVLFSEKYTGSKVARPQFSKMISQLKAYDVLVVTKLDRLARNTREALNIIEPLMNENITVRVLNIGTIENSPMGRFFLRTLLSLAEMERDMIIERTREGKEKARLRPGFREGRPRRVLTAEYLAAYELLTDLSVKEVSNLKKLSVSTIYRIKNQKESEGV